MNKYRVLLDMIKNRILFVPDRYKYNKNLILLLVNLTFLFILSLLSLLILSYTILKRPLSLIYENNFNNFEGYEIVFKFIFSFK